MNERMKASSVAGSLSQRPTTSAVEPAGTGACASKAADTAPPRTTAIVMPRESLAATAITSSATQAHRPAAELRVAISAAATPNTARRRPISARSPFGRTAIATKQETDTTSHIVVIGAWTEKPQR